MFLAVFRMNSPDEKLTEESYERKNMLAFKKKTYRQIGDEFHLKNGVYILVPSTRKPD